MVNTTHSVSNSYFEEVNKVLTNIDKAISVLKSCNENTNFKDEVGIFAREVPKFNFLSLREFVHCIRMVCTGELEPKDAIKLLEGIKSHLQKSSKNFYN